MNAEGESILKSQQTILRTHQEENTLLIIKPVQKFLKIKHVGGWRKALASKSDHS